MDDCDIAPPHPLTHMHDRRAPFPKPWLTMPPSTVWMCKKQCPRIQQRSAYKYGAIEWIANVKIIFFPDFWIVGIKAGREAIQLASAQNRKWLSGNAKGAGLPCQSLTGACPSITPSRFLLLPTTSPSFGHECFPYPFLPFFWDKYSLPLKCTLSTLSPFIPSLASPDLPLFSFPIF